MRARDRVYALQRNSTVPTPHIASGQRPVAAHPSEHDRPLFSEFSDVVFEDVVFDNNRCYPIL